MRRLALLLSLTWLTAPLYGEAPSVLVTSTEIGGDLVCDGSNPGTSIVIVHVNLRGDSPQQVKAKISLYASVLNPPTNRIIIDDTRKYATIKAGLNEVPFTIRCGPESESGTVTLGAAVIECPKPVELVQQIGDVRAQAVVHVKKPK